jgi:glyoxylase-like metal-dependent hydrolase (beta-lactamase superfamily II)
MTHMPAALSSTRYSFTLLRAGPLRLDGGSMFGIIPRVVWSKAMPADERGRIEVAHNCLLLSRVDDPGLRVLIETGSGDKFDAKNRDIFGLTDRTIIDALRDERVAPESINHVVVSHLHFDHVGGATRRSQDEPQQAEPRGLNSSVPTFPNAPIYVQRREWEDAIANNSVMTRTYLKENLEPIRDRVKLIDSPRPYEIGRVPGRDEHPRSHAIDRLSEILPGIFGLVVPGHTWAQQALLFTDDRGRTIVFTPDVMPTVNHVGAAYNMAYDVEPFVSTNSRRWFLQAAVENDWVLAIDHEPGNALQRVEPDGKGWFRLIPQPN